MQQCFRDAVRLLSFWLCGSSSLVGAKTELELQQWRNALVQGSASSGRINSSLEKGKMFWFQADGLRVQGRGMRRDGGREGGLALGRNCRGQFGLKLLWPFSNQLFRASPRAHSNFLGFYSKAALLQAASPLFCAAGMAIALREAQLLSSCQSGHHKLLPHNTNSCLGLWFQQLSKPHMDLMQCPDPHTEGTFIPLPHPLLRFLHSLNNSCQAFLSYLLKKPQQNHQKKHSLSHCFIPSVDPWWIYSHFAPLRVTHSLHADIQSTSDIFYSSSPSQSC